MRSARTARATGLEKEEAAFATAHAEVVWLTDPRKSIEPEREQPSFGDRFADDVFRRTRVGCGRGSHKRVTRFHRRNLGRSARADKAMRETGNVSQTMNR